MSQIGQQGPTDRERDRKVPFRVIQADRSLAVRPLMPYVSGRGVSVIGLVVGLIVIAGVLAYRSRSEPELTSGALPTTSSSPAPPRAQASSSTAGGSGLFGANEVAPPGDLGMHIIEMISSEPLQPARPGDTGTSSEVDPPSTVPATTGPAETSVPETSIAEESTTTVKLTTTAATAPTSTTRPTTSTTRPASPTTRPETTSLYPVAVVEPNQIVNGGFERPTVGVGGNGISGTVGWSSSDGTVELWGTGFNNIISAAGSQHVELNGQKATTISQRIAVEPGARYQWSFAHRGREDNDTVVVLVDDEVVGTQTSPPGSWQTVSGIITVPADRAAVTFAIRAVDPGSVGNLIDAVSFRRVD